MAKSGAKLLHGYVYVTKQLKYLRSFSKTIKQDGTDIEESNLILIFCAIV